MTESPSFLVGSCPTCVREVLTARDLNADGELVTVCLHCELVLKAESLRAVEVEALDALGYDVEGAPSPHGSRGCRDGQCGVQQPGG